MSNPEIGRFIGLKHLHTLRPPSYKVLGFTALLLTPKKNEDETLGDADKCIKGRFIYPKGDTYVSWIYIKEEDGKAKSVSFALRYADNYEKATKLKYGSTLKFLDPARRAEPGSNFDYKMFEHHVSLDNPNVSRPLQAHNRCSRLMFMFSSVLLSLPCSRASSRTQMTIDS